jgi:hypothetical protein
LTLPLAASKLNYMPRFIFAALISLVVGQAAAAQLSGRDLLEFPLGLVAEAPPLSTRMTASLWNPAASALSAPDRGAFGIAGLTTPKEQGVGLQMIAGEYRVRPSLTASLSFAQASVSDLVRTFSDPQSEPGEIPYSTMLASAGVAKESGSLRLGATARYRWTELDTDHSGAASLDVGGILDRVAGTPIRIAASTFLLSPTNEATSYLAAADLPVYGRDSSLAVRAGYAVNFTDGRGNDQYAFSTASYRQLDGSLGIDRSGAFGNVTTRLRLGVGLRYAGYTIAVGREDGGAGVGASYQFLFTRNIR